MRLEFGRRGVIYCPSYITPTEPVEVPVEGRSFLYHPCLGERDWEI